MSRASPSAGSADGPAPSCAGAATDTLRIARPAIGMKFTTISAPITKVSPTVTRRTARRRQSPDHHEAERGDQRPHRQQVPVEPEALADEVPGVAIGHREPDEERHRQRGTRSAHANRPEPRPSATSSRSAAPPIARSSGTQRGLQGELLGDVLREEKQDRKCSDQQRVQQPCASDRWLSQFVASSSPSPAPFGRPAAYRIGR